MEDCPPVEVDDSNPVESTCVITDTVSEHFFTPSGAGPVEITTVEDMRLAMDQLVNWMQEM